MYQGSGQANSIDAQLYGIRPALLADGPALQKIFLASLAAEGYTVLHEHQTAFVPVGFTGSIVISESHMRYRARQRDSIREALSFLGPTLAHTVMEALMPIIDPEERRLFNYHTYEEEDHTLDVNLNTCRGPDAGWLTMAHVVRAAEPEYLFVRSASVPLRRGAIPQHGRYDFVFEGTLQEFLNKIVDKIEANRRLLEERVA